MQDYFSKTDDAFVKWLNHEWGIHFDCIREDVDIQGSPERTLSRVVLRDRNGTSFLLEQFSIKKYEIRTRVARAIEFLNGNGLNQAVGCQQSKSNEFLPIFNGSCFQLSRFLNGTKIKRPDYLNSSDVGKSFADFLFCFSKASVNIEKLLCFPLFSIKKYIYKLFREMKILDYGAYKKFMPFLNFLEIRFMQVHDRLPLSFCHGDLHILNVIWDRECIRAVIDWEFTGMKPDIYDAANLVGCAGMEHPDGLGMPMVMTFLKQIRQKNIFNELSWQFFPEYILAVRFAWLSEWLRKKDGQMIEMEEAFMNILVENMEVIRKGWDIQ